MCCRAIRGELEAAVADVEEFGGDVAFPEAGEAFFAEDGFDGGDGAFVDGAGDVGVGEGVGEGVRLQLEADFDYIEGCDAEAGEVSGV